MTWEEFIDRVFTNLHLDQMFPPQQLSEIKAKIKTHTDLNAFLTSMLVQPGVAAPKPMDKCVCGADLESVLETGKLGCMQCYKHFHEALYPYLVQVQFGNNAHIGKRPTRSISPSVESLEEEMNQAVKEERYEDAAKLRDRIKEIRGL